MAAGGCVLVFRRRLHLIGGGSHSPGNQWLPTLLRNNQRPTQPICPRDQMQASHDPNLKKLCVPSWYPHSIRKMKKKKKKGITQGPGIALDERDDNASLVGLLVNQPAGLVCLDVFPQVAI